jgi:hypothetical protein
VSPVKYERGFYIPEFGILHFVKILDISLVPRGSSETSRMVGTAAR